MELLKCSLWNLTDLTPSAQLTIYWPWSQFCWSLSALPLPCHAGSWCSKHPFPGSFANGFLQRFTQWEALGGDWRADGKDWFTSHLFPHSVSTLPRKSPCIVMAPHPCKWLNVLFGSSSNLKALVLMPIRVIPLVAFLLSDSILPKPASGLLWSTTSLYTADPVAAALVKSLGSSASSVFSLISSNTSPANYAIIILFFEIAAWVLFPWIDTKTMMMLISLVTADNE